MAVSKTWAVVKREFGESVRTKTFLLGTLFGPVLILALMLLPVLMMRSGGGERQIVVVDATGQGLGEQVSTALAVPVLTGDGQPKGNTYDTDLRTIEPAAWEAMRPELQKRIDAEEIDGYVYLPPDLVEGGKASYEGRNVGLILTEEIRRAIQLTVQRVRMDRAGIAPETVAQAMRPIGFEARKVGAETAQGTPESIIMLAQVIGFAIYLVVILYGQAVLRGVLEEKRDRIVEVIMSSTRAANLMVGKIVGIGGAGLLQMAVWTLFAVAAMTWGVDYMQGRGMPVGNMLPDVPGQVGVVFLAFFVGGFMVYASIYAALGSIATTEQEAQQLQFPALLPLMLGFFLSFTGITDAQNPLFVAGSWIPLTSPIVMPVRAALTPVPALEIVGSFAVLVATVVFVAWLAAKIYRIGMLSTGKKATLREVWHWLRTA